MIMLLKEYLSSKDSLEAIHCIQELAVPHFHHELVYEVRSWNLVNQEFHVNLEPEWKIDVIKLKTVFVN